MSSSNISVFLQISMSVKLEPITAIDTPYVQTQREVSNVAAALAGLEMVSSAQVRVVYAFVFICKVRPKLGPSHSEENNTTPTN